MALIPTHFLDAVAVIEDGSEDPENFVPIATGTVLGYEAPDQGEADEGETSYTIFLATNKHVIEGKSKVWIRFNQGSGSERFQLDVKDEQGKDVFSVSDRFDVAVCSLYADALQEAGAVFSCLPEPAFLDLSGIKSLGVAGGDDVFVLGFPMGITGTVRKYAVVRGGVVARVDQEIVEETGGFLIDCAVYPGNSGGPVVLKPEALSLGDAPARPRVHILGIVSSYLPYIDTAVSQQTGEPRITFQENSGLATVVPFDAINELIEPMMDELREAHHRSAGTGTLPDDADLAPEPPVEQ